MRALHITVLAALAVCSRGESEAPAPASGEAERAPSPEEQARAIAADPRMLLFDLQTALEGVHEARGTYPSSSEFQLDESWALQRAALDAAFSSWIYESDGTGYRLAGETNGRRFQIVSPS